MYYLEHVKKRPRISAAPKGKNGVVTYSITPLPQL